MKNIATLQRHIFSSVMSSFSFVVILVFAAWLMHTGMVEEHWKEWRIALLTVPFMAVRHFNREYDSCWELIVEVFLAHFIMVILFALFYATSCLYFWEIYVPDSDVLILFTVMTGILTFTINEMAR